MNETIEIKWINAEKELPKKESYYDFKYYFVNVYSIGYKAPEVDDEYASHNTVCLAQYDPKQKIWYLLNAYQPYKYKEHTINALITKNEVFFPREAAVTHWCDLPLLPTCFEAKGEI